MHGCFGMHDLEPLIALVFLSILQLFIFIVLLWLTQPYKNQYNSGLLSFSVFLREVCSRWLRWSSFSCADSGRQFRTVHFKNSVVYWDLAVSKCRIGSMRSQCHLLFFHVSPKAACLASCHLSPAFFLQSREQNTPFRCSQLCSVRPWGDRWCPWCVRELEE